MKKYTLLPLAILLPIVVVLVYYFIYDMNNSSNALCSFRELTGLECPGCGGQRSIYFLLHGDILQALRYNLFFVIAVPFLAYFYYMAVRVYILDQKECLKSFIFKPWFGYSLIVFVILFFVLRNIPVWPFVYLAPPQ